MKKIKQEFCITKKQKEIIENFANECNCSKSKVIRIAILTLEYYSKQNIEPYHIWKKLLDKFY